MRTLIVSGLLVVGLLSQLGATAVSTGVMRYPVNLGPEADPKRIPVGWIPCESNHGYGTLELISTSYPSVPGGWKWEGGVELNGNLPSAFGISVEPEDSTNVPASPVVVRVRKQAKPAYSPYSKEQVLLATLRCLLDAVRATPRNPLTITVVTEDPEDEALQRFSGEYLTRPVPDDHFEESVLPGCRIEVGVDEQREIVFEAEGETLAKKRPPIWLPFPIEGDVDPNYLLLPVWPGNGFTGDPLGLLGRPWPVVQDVFQSAVGNSDGNLVTRRQRVSHFRAGKTENAHKLYADLNVSPDEPVPEEVAMLCWAAVLSAQPTQSCPLEVTLRIGKELDPRFRIWVEKEGWEEISISTDKGIRASFVWDPATAKLTTGTIPEFQIERQDGGGWAVVSRAVLAARLEAAEEEAELPDE